MKYPTIQIIPKLKTVKGLFVVEEQALLDFNTEILETLMSEGAIATRNHNELEGHAIYLDDDIYDWTLVRDSDDALCLVPLRKSTLPN